MSPKEPRRRRRARTSVVGVSSRGRIENRSTRSSGRATLGSQRSEEGHVVGQIPVGRPPRCFRGRDGRRSGEHYRGRGRKCPPVVVKRGVRLPGALQHHQLPQLSIGSWKRWSTMVNDPRTSSLSSTRTAGGRILAGARQYFGGESSTVAYVRAGGLTALLAVQPHSVRGNVPVDFCVGRRGGGLLPRELCDSGGRGKRSVAR